jgi:succinate dehydrogenase / fumarate reductase, cytochrome b subunit
MILYTAHFPLHSILSSIACEQINMSWLVSFFRSSLGRKYLLAVTGVILFGFVLGHMAGNLQIFLGREKLNDYAEFLQQTKGLLWGTRITLLGAFLVHIWAAISLTHTSLKARPISYQRDLVSDETTFAARTMRWTGPIVLLFLLYHLAHLTLGVAGPKYIQGDVYSNVIRGFRVPMISALYLISQAALALHLYHGLWSLFQTVGLAHPKYNAIRRPFAGAFAALIFLGNCAIPVAILCRFIGGDV